MREYDQLRETWDADAFELVSDFIDLADHVVVRFIWRGAGRGPEFNMEITGVYTVRGSHTYASAATFTVAVNIVDEGGATATAVGDANVSSFTPIAISGQAFKDLNGDGVKDAGEPGIDGVTITLDRGADGTVDATTTTSGGGLYSFSGLGPGTYRIRQAARHGRQLAARRSFQAPLAYPTRDGW